MLLQRNSLISKKQKKPTKRGTQVYLFIQFYLNHDDGDVYPIKFKIECNFQIVNTFESLFKTINKVKHVVT